MEMPNSPFLDQSRLTADTRRQFLGWGTGGLGAFFLNAAMAQTNASKNAATAVSLPIQHDPSAPLSPLPPPFAPKVRRVIYLHMGGSPSQLELFDHKPELTKFSGRDCPEVYLKGKRFAFITGVPKLMGTMYPFHQAGKSGIWMSDRLPHLEKRIDDLCVINSMRTDQFNHAPAQLLVQTGDPRIGHASLGSWVTYGLGSENQNLPGFIVMSSLSSTVANAGKPLGGRVFCPAFIRACNAVRPANRFSISTIPKVSAGHSAGRFWTRWTRSTARPIRSSETLRPWPGSRNMRWPSACSWRPAMRWTSPASPRRCMPAMAPNPGKTSFANNCLVARRLAERGVRFIQLYHWGWDTHGTPVDQGLNVGLVDCCHATDQPTAALLGDLQERGLLDDTLIVWGGDSAAHPCRKTAAARK